MSQTPVDVTENIFTELKIYFKDAEIVELAATIAMENYRARFNRAFLIEAQGLDQPKVWDPILDIEPTHTPWVFRFCPDRMDVEYQKGLTAYNSGCWSLGGLRFSL